MGFFWDNPDSPDVRRRQEADARRREEDKEREKKKAKAKLEKKLKEEKLELDRQRREEDEKAINEMAKKFLGDQGAKNKAGQALNRGPGLGAGSMYKNPQVDLSQGLPQPGFNPNAPRIGHEPETQGKGSQKKDASGAVVPRLPRPI